MSIVVTIPSKEEAKVQGWNKSKSYYIIDNIKTQMIENVNQAIDYYYQKYKTFINLYNNKLQQQNIVSAQIMSLEQLFNQAMDQYNTQVVFNWENVQKQSSQDLQIKAQQLNVYTQWLQKHGQNNIALRDILAFFSTNGVVNYNQIPGKVDLNTIQGLINKFIGSSSNQQSPRQLGGHRSRLMGEIIEQGANSIIAENTQGLIGYVQVGSKNSILPNRTVAQGKTDGMLFVNVTMDGGLIQHSQNFYKAFGQFPQYTTTKNHNLILEASEIFDLSYGGLQQGLNSYVNNSLYGSMLGITNKAWTGTTGTLGSFSISANEIRNRKSEGIEEFFKDKQEFHLYTSFVTSKYLINIIGAFNGIVSTGSTMQPTYLWLANLYNNYYTIRHSDNLKDSSISWSGEEWGKKYKVHNSIIVARSI